MTQSENATLDSVVIDSVCSYVGTHGSSEKILSAGLSIQKVRDESRYTLNIRDMCDNRDISTMEVIYDNANAKLYTDFKNTIKSSELRRLLTSRPWPKIDIDSRIHGEFDLGTSDGIMKISNNVYVTGETISKCFPDIRTSLSTMMDGVVRLKEGVVSLTSMNCMVNGSDGLIDMSASLSNPLPIWSKQEGHIIEQSLFNSKHDLLQLNINNFDIGSLFAKNSPFSIEATVHGKFSISSANGTFSVRSLSDVPMQLHGLTLTKKMKKICENVNLACGVVYHSDGQKSDIEVNDFVMTSANGEEAILGNWASSWDKDFKEVSAKSFIVAQLDKLSTWPLFPRNVFVKSGIYAGDFACQKSGNFTKITNTAKLRSYLAANQEKPINGTVTVDLQHTNITDKVMVDFDLQGIAESDAKVVVDLINDVHGAGQSGNVEITGAAISIPDLIQVGNLGLNMVGMRGNNVVQKGMLLAKNATDNSQAMQRLDVDGGAGEITLDSIPSMKVVVDVNTLSLSDTFVMNKLQSTAVTDSSKIEIKNLNFNLANAPFQLKSLLKCVPNGYEFSMTAVCDIQDFGALSRLIWPGYAATIEGTGDFSLVLQGKESTMRDAIRLAKGSVSLNSRDGIIRPVMFLGPRKSSLIESIGAIGRLFGGTNDSLSKIGDFSRQLEAIEYDDINIEIVRKENLDIAFDRCTVTGPEILLEATGGVKYVKGKFPLQSPLAVDVALSAGGKLGAALEGVGLAFEQSDGSRYMSGPRFAVRGTLANPDFSDILYALYKLY